MVVDKIVAGMISSLVLSPDDLPEGVNEILLGPKTYDVISSKLTLGPPVEVSKQGTPPRSFTVSMKGSVVRDIKGCFNFPRCFGTGKVLEKSIAKGSTFFEQVAQKDLERKGEKFLQHNVIPKTDLCEVAHHYMDSLTPPHLERLRRVARALDGATIRLATTCSGLESMPSILRAIFRQERAKFRTNLSITTNTYIHTYIHAYIHTYIHPCIL